MSPCEACQFLMHLMILPTNCPLPHKQTPQPCSISTLPVMPLPAFLLIYGTCPLENSTSSICTSVRALQLRIAKLIAPSNQWHRHSWCDRQPHLYMILRNQVRRLRSPLRSRTIHPPLNTDSIPAALNPHLTCARSDLFRNQTKLRLPGNRLARSDAVR